MVTETYNSFKDNIRRRVTNPFLGTFTFVYIIKNWVLFYGIFNFDNTETQSTKIEYINKYFQTVNPIWNLIYCVLYSFGILLATYLFMAISKLIVDSYNELLVPLITKITNKGKVVERSTYLQLQIDKDNIEIKCEKEKEERLKAQKERDDNEIKYLELKMSDKSTQEVAKLKEEIQLSKFKLDSLANELAIANSNKAEIEKLMEKFKNENEILLKVKEKNSLDLKMMKDVENNLHEYENNLEREINLLKKENETLKLEKEQNSSKLEKSLRDISEMLKRKEEYENEINRLENKFIEMQFSSNQDRSSVIEYSKYPRFNTSTDDSLAHILYNKIKDENLVELLESIFHLSNVGTRIVPNEFYRIEFFIDNNIISLSERSQIDGTSRIFLSPLGYKIYNLRLLEINQTSNYQEIYLGIIKRFPDSKIANYLKDSMDGNKVISKDFLINELQNYVSNIDPNQYYLDEESKNDVLRFIERLNEL